MTEQQNRASAIVDRYADARNMAVVAAEFGISRERVRQILNKAGISTARVRKPKEPGVGRGGRREGAGRPAVSANTEKVAITISGDDVLYLRNLGGGNLSAGVRQAAAFHRGAHTEAS